MRSTRLLALALAFSLSSVAPAAGQTGDSNWFYRDSEIARDPTWIFGTLPNGVRYAIRRNPLPEGLVSIRVRMDVGGLNEEDDEQGWAHLIEHLAFRGTRSFADGEGREAWQRLGASFGSDTNATTSSTQTVYQLDLPRADKAGLDLSLNLLSEMMDSARFDPAVVEAERKIVLAEKGRRPELGVLMSDLTRSLFFSGLKIAKRDTIGTDATLGGATSEKLKSFYERWYRPERATIVMVGDADPKMMEQLVIDRFGGWKGEGPAASDPDYGAIAPAPENAIVLAYPTAPHLAQIVWVRPWAPPPNSIAEQREDLGRMLASRIINRRLEARARGGQASFTGAGLGTAELAKAANMTQLQVRPREGKWQESLGEAFSILADALRAPPSEAEISREMQNVRTAVTAAVDGDDTVLSQNRADQLIRAVDGGDVVASAKDSLALIESVAPQMTPAYVFDAMKALFEGEGPRMILTSPTPIAGGSQAAAEALANAQKAAPAIREPDRTVSIDDLPPLGNPGAEVSRETVDGLDATIVRFANGSTLTFKQTGFEKGSVAVKVRVGNGVAGLPSDRRSPTWLAGIVALSGMADMDIDSLERLMTGRRLGLSFGIGEDAYFLQGVTNKADLPDQLRLMATKLAYPRWDERVFERVKADMLDNFDLSFSSASARAGRELNGLLRSGDPRWMPVSREVIAGTSFDDFKSFFEAELAKGPIDVTIVGDVDLDTAIGAVKASIAALPPATIERPRSTNVRPPAPSSAPQSFTHQGDGNQAFAAIGWSTFGGMKERRQRRALALAANMMQTRLFEQLRQVEGASYSPTALAATSDIFEDWGIFYASSELRPESVPTFFRIARQVAADLAAKPVSQAEFERALNPVLTGIDRRIRTNGYWLGTMEDWARRPESIDVARSFIEEYRSLTPEEVRQAVADYVADSGDWSMTVFPAKDRSGAD